VRLDENEWYALVESSLQLNFGSVNCGIFEVVKASGDQATLRCDRRDRPVLQAALTLISSIAGRRCRIDNVTAK